MRSESYAWCCAGSLDRTVKLWDLHAGMQIATSRFQPCGVRALALDQDMLVCSASKVFNSTMGVHANYKVAQL